MASRQTDKNSSETDAKTFADFDLLGLEQFGDRLKNHVVAEYPFADGSLVISLDGRFGSGKTCFLEMFEQQLKEDEFEAIYVNAWRNDFFDDPIVTLLAEIIEYIDKNNKLFGKSSNKIKATSLSILGGVANVGNQFIASQVGIDFQETAETIKKQIHDRDCQIGNAVFEEYKEKKALFDKLNELLSKCVEELKEKPLFILVDELDRARPDYAVKFLETLKHFFQTKTKGIVFILAVDKAHLESSVKSLYGSDINFPEYYRKFVHRNVSLPAPIETSIDNYTAKKIEEYFNAELKGCFFAEDKDSNLNGSIINLSVGLKLTPRQINELLRILCHYFSTSQRKDNVPVGWIVSPIIYAAIHLQNVDKARQIRTDKFGYKDLLNFFDHHFQIKNHYDLNKRKREWWDRMLLYICSTEDNYETNIAIYIQKHPPVPSESSELYLSKVQWINAQLEYATGEFRMFNDKPIIMEVGQKIDECLRFFDD